MANNRHLSTSQQGIEAQKFYEPLSLRPAINAHTWGYAEEGREGP